MNQNNFKFVSALLVIVLIAGVSTLANAQSFGEEELEQAVAIMRAAGQTEAEIQQFLDAIQMVESMQIPATNSDASDAEKIQALTGMTDAEMQVVGPIAGTTKARQDEQIAAQLQKEIADFEKRYADKPRVTAILDGKTRQMRLLRCRTTDAYDFELQSAPETQRKAGPRIIVSRGWSVAQGVWLASVHAQTDDGGYLAKLPPGPLPGKTFSFNGPVESEESPGVALNLQFEATCDQ